MSFRTLALLAPLAITLSHPVSAQNQHRNQNQSQQGMVPFTMDHRAGARTASPVDVSFLLDAPAGKHGFVVVKDGHLATEDGGRIRCWGVNITDWSSARDAYTC